MARATGAPPDAVVREAAASLASFADDPTSLVTACHRLIDRHAANGPVWWLCARTLSAPDPGDEAWRCLDDLVSDPTPDELAHALPEGAEVVLVGGTRRAVGALTRRGDISVGVLDVAGDGAEIAADLARNDIAAQAIGPARLAPAVAGANVVVVCPSAIGPSVALAEVGAWAAAAVAHAASVPVWLVAGAGALVPAAMWPALEERVDRAAATARAFDRLPLALVDELIGPSGPEPLDVGLRRVDTPVVPDLMRTRGSRP